jgi:glutamate-1-semialdehyde 2,1-aminomutase
MALDPQWLTAAWTPSPSATVAALAVAAASAPWVLRTAWLRLLLSRGKHRSLAGHSRMAKRVARLLPGYSYTEAQFFAADGAPAPVQAQRRLGLQRLSQALRERSPQTLALTAELREGLSDLQFTGRYRVPFQFSDGVRQHLPLGAFWASADGVSLTDLDGNRHWDLTGSYGVNLFGVDFYKSCMAEGLALGNALGPVLGGYAPCMLDNVQRLRRLSGMDEVSFHMSGTEAVMQAVRLARYHTGKRHLVRFAGAYHGWWEDVQPGPGNPLPPRETHTLAEMSDRALAVLERRNDIACVLVNPLQALHPNRNAPGDSTLVDGLRHTPTCDRAAYTAWLHRLREVCTRRGMALILDEVFLGFRLAPGGAQQYFGVQADLVTYGKTLGGGFPVGVVCGKAAWMRRYKPERPGDICFARGTFNAHPAVMGAMNVFLRRLDTPEVQALYQDADARWARHLRTFNTALAQADLPLQAQGLGTVWTLNFLRPGRYHWLLQFYLREAGLALSWVGTGRFIFTLAHTDDDMADITRRFVQAARQMQADGWLWLPEGEAPNFKRQVLKEMLLQRFFNKREQLLNA